MDLPERNRSTIVSIALHGRDAGPVPAVLEDRSVVAAARDGNLRIGVHFYNDEDGIDRLTSALAEVWI